MKKFLDAFRGLKIGLSDRSIRIQCLLGCCIITAGLMLGFAPGEWLAVIILVGMVIAAEMFNTCIEMLCDKICPEFNETIGKIKDLSAAGVLVCAISALFAALVIVIY